MLTILRILHVGVQPVSVERYRSKVAHCVGHQFLVPFLVLPVLATAGTQQDVLPSLFARSKLTFQIILSVQIFFSKNVSTELSPACWSEGHLSLPTIDCIEGVTIKQYRESLEFSRPTGVY